jgi:hypothetical protein
MRGMTGIASWDSHLGRGFLLCPHYPPAFWHARRPISRPNDVYTDLPVPNAMRKFHAERLVKGRSTRGQAMCLAQMETKADDQGQKALQAWARSLYGGSWTISVCGVWKWHGDLLVRHQSAFCGKIPAVKPMSVIWRPSHQPFFPFWIPLHIGLGYHRDTGAERYHPCACNISHRCASTVWNCRIKGP